MPIQELIQPIQSTIQVELEPVHNQLYSLVLLNQVERYSGLGDWVMRTYQAMSVEERQRNRLVMEGLHPAVMPNRSWHSFLGYVDFIENLDPQALQQKMLDTYSCKGQPESCEIDWEQVLKSAESYVGFLEERFGADHIDHEVEVQAYGYVVDPPAMQHLIVSHLRLMWEKYLADEWNRTRPVLQQAVNAFQQTGVADMPPLEAARFITGRDPENDLKLEKHLREDRRFVFIPHPHCGPYIGHVSIGDRFGIIFGARLPQGVQIDASELNRTDILVRLNALAEETRLRILKLLSERGELCSQDIILLLEISQPAASRHLTQLTAAGFLNERRMEGAKCYSLNTRRIEDTLRAISGFLLKG
jgi:DNA-binding transcriptional ArsR family regulator